MRQNLEALRSPLTTKVIVLSHLQSIVHLQVFWLLSSLRVSNGLHLPAFLDTSFASNLSSTFISSGIMTLKLLKLIEHTPPKINIEPEIHGLVQMIFLFQGCLLSGSMVIFRGQFHPVSTWLPWLQNPSNSQWHHNPLVLVSSFQGDDFELRGHGLCCEHRHEKNNFLCAQDTVRYAETSESISGSITTFDHLLLGCFQK